MGNSVGEEHKLKYTHTHTPLTALVPGQPG